MKALKVLTATAALSVLLTTPALADVSTDIYYNGELLNTTQPVVNVDGRVLLAFRDLFENLDGQVSWSDEFRMASVTYGKNTINLFPDTGAVQINGVPQALEVGPQIINDRVYLPLRFVAQSLGSTVDYSKGSDDTGIIEIHAIDSVQNYAQRDGKVTKILRTTTAPVSTIKPTAETQAAYQQWKQHNSAYLLDDHGNLVEIQSYDQKIQVNVIDFNNAKVESKTYDTNILYPAFTSLQKVDKTFTIGINETSSTRYAGVGTPLNTSGGTLLDDTLMGDLTLYDSKATGNVFRFDAATDSSAGITSTTTNGKVLDLALRTVDSSNNTYAVADNGSYAFLMDGHLLIVDSNNDVQEDIRLTKKTGDAKLFAVDNQFIIVAVDTDLRYPEVYAAVYNTNGSMQYYFHNISNITKVTDDETFYEYNNLKINDMAISGNVLYLLAKTDMDYYLIQYNFHNNTSSKEQLSIKEKIYSGFVYSMNDVKLFSADDDYFYLRDVN
jgi:hypothetical protein